VAKAGVCKTPIAGSIPAVASASIVRTGGIGVYVPRARSIAAAVCPSSSGTTCVT